MREKFGVRSLEFGVRARAARPYIVLAGLVALVGMVGCAGQQKAPDDPFAYGVYGVLNTSMAAYGVINNTFTDFRAQYLISDQGWAEYEEIANKFIDEHQALSKAMAAYKRGEKPQSAVELVQKAMQKALEELKKYYADKIPKEKQKPLF